MRAVIFALRAAICDESRGAIASDDSEAARSTMIGMIIPHRRPLSSPLWQEHLLGPGDPALDLDPHVVGGAPAGLDPNGRARVLTYPARPSGGQPLAGVLLRRTSAGIEDPTFGASGILDLSNGVSWRWHRRTRDPTERLSTFETEGDAVTLRRHDEDGHADPPFTPTRPPSTPGPSRPERMASSRSGRSNAAAKRPRASPTSHRCASFA